MATSQMFDSFLPTAAQTASGYGMNGGVNPRGSAAIYIANKPPTTGDLIKHKCKMVMKFVGMPFKAIPRRTRKEPKHIQKSDISKPSARTDKKTLELLEGRPNTAGTAASLGFYIPSVAGEGYNRNSKLIIHNIPPTPTPQASTSSNERKNVVFAHPVADGVQSAPPTPATTSTQSIYSGINQINTGRLQASTDSSQPGTPLFADIARNAFRKSKGRGLGISVEESPEEFAHRMDGHKKAANTLEVARPVSAISQESSSTVQTDSGLLLAGPRVSSEPPRISTPPPFDPHISRFDNPEEPYYPGKYLRSRSRLNIVDNAADDEVEESPKPPVRDVHDFAEAEDNSASDSIPDFKPRRPAYTSVCLPDINDGRIYFALNQGVGEGFSTYENAPYASSATLPTNRDSSFTLSGSASTRASTPDLPFTPGKRHSEFYGKIEQDFDAVDDLPPRPTNPEPPMLTGSQEFLENVYKTVPSPPPQPQRDTLVVPARNPVPRRAAEPTAGPSKAKGKPDVNKSLPPSPAPDSPRRFTPLPTSQFPPRTDSLNNLMASSSHGPQRPRHQRSSMVVEMDPAKVPNRKSMNENGFPIYDARLSRDLIVKPAYRKSEIPMNPMEQKERETKIKRAASKKAAEVQAEKVKEETAAKAIAKAEKKVKKDERAVRKLLGR